MSNYNKSYRTVQNIAQHSIATTLYNVMCGIVSPHACVLKSELSVCGVS